MPISLTIVLSFFADIHISSNDKYWVFGNEIVGIISASTTFVVEGASLILIIIAIKNLNASSRYLYRYIAFVWGEFVITILILVYIFLGEDLYILWVIIFWIDFLMVTWRILEVTVLNRYFNSLKNKKNAD